MAGDEPSEDAEPGSDPTGDDDGGEDGDAGRDSASDESAGTSREGPSSGDDPGGEDVDSGGEGADSGGDPPGADDAATDLDGTVESPGEGTAVNADDSDAAATGETHDDGDEPADEGTDHESEDAEAGAEPEDDETEAEVERTNEEPGVDEGGEDGEPEDDEGTADGFDDGGEEAGEEPRVDAEGAADGEVAGGRDREGAAADDGPGPDHDGDTAGLEEGATDVTGVDSEREDEDAAVEDDETAVNLDEGNPEDFDEMPTLSPDLETDEDVDPPAPSDAEEADPDAELDADAEADLDADSTDVSSPIVDDVDEADAGGTKVDEADAAEGMFGGSRSGPAEDREMPLAEHIREMLKRLAVVVAVAGVVSLLVFPFAEDVINFLWYSILPGVESEIARPRLYGVLELLFTELKVASLAGLIVALPVLVYETYAFMRPGLYPHERRYYLAAIPTSLVLAIVGVAFAYFVVLPAIFVYFLYYSQDVATIGFALGRTFDLILLMMGYLAVVFQIPLFIMLAMMMGLVTRRWLADRRLLFWGAFLGISFIFSFDPTGMAPIIVAATMIVLFEGTLLLTKWTGRE